MSGEGDLSSITVENDVDIVRPSINLRSGIEITGGDGSIDNPYIVK